MEVGNGDERRWMPFASRVTLSRWPKTGPALGQRSVSVFKAYSTRHVVAEHAEVTEVLGDLIDKRYGTGEMGMSIANSFLLCLQSTRFSYRRRHASNLRSVSDRGSRTWRT
jgi:hypothetical protein